MIYSNIFSVIHNPIFEYFSIKVSNSNIFHLTLENDFFEKMSLNIWQRGVKFHFTFFI